LEKTHIVHDALVSQWNSPYSAGTVGLLLRNMNENLYKKIRRSKGFTVLLFYGGRWIISAAQET